LGVFGDGPRPSQGASSSAAHLTHLRACAADYTESESLSERQKALLRWTEAVTRNTAEEDDEAFEAIRRHYSDAEIAELTLMSGLFNIWNRSTRALQIELEPREERELAACLAPTTPVQAEVR
jgi:hypothetical protein